MSAPGLKVLRRYAVYNINTTFTEEIRLTNLWIMWKSHGKVIHKYQTI